jgi:hypothetical protein
MKIDYERGGKKVTRAKPTTIKPHALLVCKGGAKTLRLPSYKQGFDHGAAPHMLSKPSKHYSLASNLLPTCYQNPINLPNLNFESSFQLVLSNKLGGLATHFGNSTRISYSLLNVDRRRQSAMKSQSNKQPGSGSFRHLDKLPDGVEARDSRTIALLLKLLYKYWCNILRIFLTLFFNKI